ncbi:hypothetical protein SUGI_0954140 [Cryptomeria japonica]|uniref:disease resistance protein RUN1 n=1 Tax=Cryptomeria japonica TaxID=3369 RepID=UPI002414961B|nr:disease resistance protein RUN1 [Cryptomeria japonica]GLJ45328.1 hypothetical protein SUGI_0954140 [Cryptomeria japonica]
MEQYKPPTSKLAFQGDKRYHVFLSFRGEDVRKTLVDHLFQALSAAGLHVFIDSEKLKKGEMIGLSLETAIESSAIRIPVFSKGYADSTWCLKEAAAMLSTPGLIIPLFYHMDPTHVRYPVKDSSPYSRSFLKHYGHPDRHPIEEVDDWKDALQTICSRSGWSMDITQGYEAQLVETVVNDLIMTLDRVPLEVAKHPVGMDSVTNALIQKLNLNSKDEVVRVGIWGVGGVGKTTVAKVIYNQIYTNFDAASFVFNVRTTAAEPSGLTKLQEIIIKNLSEYGEKVDSVDKGISLYRDRLGGKRALLVLDDVDAIVQLNALVGDWLAPGSRVIITSRDKHILNVARVSSECIHEMTGLGINEGLQLFSWYAFLRAVPSPNYEDLSKRIVEACKGHPLSLEVIGSFLSDRQDDTGCWMEALENITFNPEIHEKLYISYKALTDEEKEIFLDIACFFIGEDKTCPIIFWKSLYKKVDTAVSNLSMKLLIKIEDGVFGMHDHLRDMGRTIAEKEREGTRLWEVAQLSTISHNINFSRLRISGGNPRRLEMLYGPGLRYLHLQNIPIEDMIKDPLAMVPPNLVWLRLESCDTDNKMNGGIKRPRHSKFVSNNIWQLKTLQLRNCYGVSSLSLSSIFSLPNIQLQHLDLRGYRNLGSLPETIANLSQLQHLDLIGWKSLKSLPDAIGNLSKLQHLNLKRCLKLKNLPKTIGKLSKLQHLDLRDCQTLKYLPYTIGYLSQLRHLDLGECTLLCNLPSTIGKLSHLQHLVLERCIFLTNLPDTITNLSQLQHLNLRGCRKLNSLPNTIGNLSQLQQLDLRGCRMLNSFPNTIGNLSQLQHLDLRGCRRLASLPNTIGNLSQLQHLDLRGCRMLNSLPDTIGNLSQLQFLKLGGCERLNNANIPQLEHLDLGLGK